MERGLIRKRWQVTLPRELRRQLNLFIGQALNFTVDEHYCIVVSTGVMPSAEEGEFYKLLKGEKPRFPRGKKFRISEGRRASKVKLLDERRLRKIEKSLSYLPVDPETAGFLDQVRESLEARTELKDLLSNMSRYIIALQKRI